MWRPKAFDSYDAGGELPLGGYACLVGLYGVSLAGAAARVDRSEGPAGDGLRGRDLLVLGAATYQLSRIVTKDKVLAPFRSPFTTFVETAGAGEVKETSRGDGLQKAVGDLLTCPYCLAPWVASALSLGVVVRPRLTRWFAGLFTIVAFADVCQQGYAALKKLTP
jgi:hypothetical protein